MNVLQPLRSRRLLAALAALSLPFLTGCATFLAKAHAWDIRRMERVTDAYVSGANLGIVYLRPGWLRRRRIVWCSLPWLRGSGRDRELRLPNQDRPDAAAPAQPPAGAERVPVGRLAEGETPSLPPGASITIFERRKRPYRIVVVLADRSLADGEQVVWLEPGWFKRPGYQVKLALAAVFDVVTMPIQAVVFGTIGLYCAIARGR